MKIKYKFKKGDCVDCGNLTVSQVQSILERMWELGAKKGEDIDGLVCEYKYLSWRSDRGHTYFYSDIRNHNLVTWGNIMKAHRDDKMTLKKFEGTLGDFAERYINGETFYQLDSGHEYEIPRGMMDSDLKNYYHDIYYKEESHWYDDLGDGVLCWVWDDEGDDRFLDIIKNYNTSVEYRFESPYDSWENAQPVTQEEANKLIWSSK